MNHASLFSGIGAAELAASWMGWNNLFNCEIEKFCRQVLKYHFPKSHQYENIKETDFTIWRGRVDILSGGFPCQPYSNAGNRKGKKDDRHLWPEMYRAIKEIQPTWVLGENVYGLINWERGLVLHEIKTDLENIGYKVQSYLIPAASVNAPHKRDRLFIVAYSRYNKYKESNEFQKNDNKFSKKRKKERNQFASCIRDGIVAYSESIRRGNLCHKIEKKRSHNSNELFRVKHRLQSKKRIIANSNGRRQSPKKYRKEESGWFAKKGISDFWQNFPTQSAICGRDDGISSRLDNITFPKWRNESIKAYGNAIVPQVIYQIFKAIQEYENINSKK